MNASLTRWTSLFPFLLLLSGCNLQGSELRIGLLVLVPFLLIIGAFWWLNQRGAEQNWEEEHFPDQEDDDDEDHFLM
jgi:hypothetical protein